MEALSFASASPTRQVLALVVVGKPCEEILSVARDREIEFIMLGEQSHGGLTGLFHKSLADQAAR